MEGTKSLTGSAGSIVIEARLADLKSMPFFLADPFVGVNDVEIVILIDRNGSAQDLGGEKWPSRGQSLDTYHPELMSKLS